MKRTIFRAALGCILVSCLVCFCGCSSKSTDDLLADLKSDQAAQRVRAVRLLPQRKTDAEKIVPAFIDSLGDKDDDVRWGAAIGLGYFGEQAKDAIPALKKAERDPDARVREAAGVALSRIDPTHFQTPVKKRARRGS